MPYPSGTLTAFMRRDAQDHMLFAWVHAMRRGLKHGLPGVPDDRIEEHVSVEVAVRDFAAFMNLQPHEFNVSSQAKRYARIMADFIDDQRTSQ